MLTLLTLASLTMIILLLDFLVIKFANEGYF
jgi:hypothetical protein